MQLVKASSAQVLGFLVALLAVWLARIPGLWPLIVLQAPAAACFSRMLRQPRWWMGIHLTFAPALLGMTALHLQPGVYLLALLLLLLVFWGTVKGDVPLFLSSRAVNDTLMIIVDREKAGSFIDLGAGTGSVVVPLARHRSRMAVEAWEHAPIPWMICAWRCRDLPNTQVYRNTFWECDLSIFDVVFAFLSPAAMPRLGVKVLREMHPGALLVSSSFPIPDWEPESVVQLEDRMHTRLYCYRIKS